MKQDIRRLIKSLWIRACRFDGIPIDSKFVCLSNDNSYIRRYNKMMGIYLAGLGRCAVK